MPELPDIVVYLEALRRRIQGETLDRIRILDPFVLRSVEPRVEELAATRVVAARRLGKRIVIVLAGDLYVVIHLMIAGRLRWLEGGVTPGRRGALAAFDFSSGTLVLREAGSKRRASLHLVRGAEELATHDPGGLEVIEASPDDFASALRAENHTLKRALTDPRILSGIGNAYSDEILHRAGMSPFAHTSKLDDDQLLRLRQAVRSVLEEWTDRLRAEAGDAFPERVTAFREGMAVHGRHGQPCPVCDSPVQRIVYAANEANYCPGCQTNGRIFADRALSRLLKSDWPKNLDELEQLRSRHREGQS